MTFQERWAEGPPVGEAPRENSEMTDLLTPADVERIKEVWWPNIQKLCRNYLTLWDRNEELEATMEKVAKLARQVKKELVELKELWGRP